MRTQSCPDFARLTLAALAVAASLGACKKEDAVAAPPAIGALAVVQGNNQSVQAGKELPLPVILRVVSTNGDAMAGIPVAIVVAEGGGAVAPPSGISDSKGEFTTKWTLGPRFVDNQLRASVPGLDPVKVFATAIVPTDIVVAQGNLQTAKVGAALPTSIVVRVVGSGNVPMANVTVLFQVISGGGSISPQSAVTNTLGEVTTKWTLGSVAGLQMAAASTGTLSPANLTATATP